MIFYYPFVVRAYLKNLKRNLLQSFNEFVIKYRRSHKYIPLIVYELKHFITVKFS